VDAIIDSSPIGQLSWWVDAESGQLQGADQIHDGISANLCLSHADESLSFVPHSDGYGAFAIQVHLEESWPWGPGSGRN
jgi:hypothetical protein